VNPLFCEDEEDQRSEGEDGRSREQLPEKSASSGYGSHRCNSSSESGTEDQAEAALLRDDAVTILEQNLGYVKSILVALKGTAPSPRKHSQRAVGVTLTPIPEGKVDYCIPRPVWPRHQDVAPDSIVDDALLLYTSLTYTPSERSCGNSTEKTDPTVIPSQELVRELSNTITQVRELRENGTPKDVFRKTLKLGTLQRNPCPEEILRKLSVSLCHRESLTKVSRALSNSSSSSGGSLRTRPAEDRETARLLLLQRLERCRSASSTTSSGFSSSCSSQHGDLSSAMVYGALCQLGGAYQKLRTSEVQGQDRSLPFKSACYVSTQQFRYHIPQQQTLTLQNNPQTDLDLRHRTLGYGFHIQR
jgi:hypothetical protein